MKFLDIILLTIFRVSADSKFYSTKEVKSAARDLKCSIVFINTY